MCIRDRHTKREECTIELYGSMYGGTGCLIDHAASPKDVQAAEPVSYTHLDVYKRQEYNHAIEKGKRELFAAMSGFQPNALRPSDANFTMRMSYGLSLIHIWQLILTATGNPAMCVAPVLMATAKAVV